MRISIDIGDPGYENYLKHRGARVFLDGAERSDVLTADEEKRYAICEVRDQAGWPVIDPATHKSKTYEFFGHVRVELAEPA